MTTEATMRGKITRLVKQRGYGFITPDDAVVASHFFNANGLSGMSQGFHSLNEGDRVTFQSVLTPMGARAIDVLVCGDEDTKKESER